MDIINTIRGFSDLRVLVIGDIMLDIYDFCLTSNSKSIDYEKEGKRAYKASESIKILGGAGNVAANLAAMGANTSIISIVGNDGNAGIIKYLLREKSVDVKLFSDNRPTTTKTRLYIDGEYILRRDDELSNKISLNMMNNILGRFHRLLKNIDVVILSDYNKGLFSKNMAQEIIKHCNIENKPVIVDFKPENLEYFTNATIISPNDKDANIIYPKFNSIGNWHKTILSLYKKCDAKNIVVTLGKWGICGTDGAKKFLVEGENVKEVNPVGCGDTVRAVLALVYAQESDLELACKFANAAGALIVQKETTATITQKDLMYFMEISNNE